MHIFGKLVHISKIEFSLLGGGGGWGGREEESSKKRFFHGKRHDNKILKVEILLSRNYVVIAQAFAWKLASRTAKQVSRKLVPLWQPGAHNDTINANT